MPNKKQAKKHHVKRVLTPSLLSGALVLTAAFLATALMIVIFMTNAGTLQQNLINWHRDEPPKTLTLPGQELPQNDHPTLLGSWPLVVIWAFVGLVLYGVASYIVHTFMRAAHFKQTYTYVSALPNKVVEALVRQLELRVTAFIILVAFAYLAAIQLLPYCILLARASASDLTSVHGIGYAFVSFVAITISLHVITIFSRLSCGRVRLFS